MFRDEFYFEYSEGDVGLAMRMWERESLQYSFIFAFLFTELLHLILSEEKILLGERKKMYGRGSGWDRGWDGGENIPVWVLFYRFPPGGSIVLNSDKLANLKFRNDWK